MPDDRVTASTIGLSLAAASGVPNFLAGMLPSLMTIKRFGANDEDRAALRRGELVGGTLALGLGVGASLVAESWLPAVATIVVLGVMVCMYEEAIRHPHADAKPIDEQSDVSPCGCADTEQAGYASGVRY